MANRILVVEDDTAISELICMNLEVTGYEVVPVLDGNEVEGTLEKEEDFDLALLDIMLPGKDGFELLGVMKEHGIPVIYTLLHLKWVTNKDLLYSTGNPAQCDMEACMGGKLRRGGIRVCVWLSPFVVHLKLSQHC